MGMLDNLFRLCRMSDVIVQFLLQIGKVILNLNIVIIGNQLPSINQVSQVGRVITAMELDDITHFKLEATSLPSKAIINL